MKEFLLYITVDKTNGYVYGGFHYGTREDEYIGSGKRLLTEIKSKGRDNFERRWLGQSYKTLNCALQAEIRLIRHLRRMFTERCYNIHYGGNGGDALFYASDTRKSARGARITEGKKTQYSTGFTSAQKAFHKKHSKHLKDRWKNDDQFVESMLQYSKERGQRLSKRLKSGNLTEKEVERNKKFTRRSLFTVTITYPDKTVVTEKDTCYTWLQQKYTLDDVTLMRLMNEKVSNIKRVTSRTKHSFPVGTILQIIV